MPVNVAIMHTLGIVQVHAHEPIEPDDPIEIIHNSGKSLSGPDIVSGGKDMAGIYAHAEPIGVFYPFNDTGNLLECATES
jgi:hypothetical protein